MERLLKVCGPKSTCEGAGEWLWIPSAGMFGWFLGCGVGLAGL